MNQKALLIRLPDDLMEKVENRASENSISKNDVIKLILQEFFKKGGAVNLTIKDIDPEILKRLPRSFQVFYRVVKDSEKETQQKTPVQKRVNRGDG